MVDGSWSQGCEFLRITCVLVMLFRKMVAISLYTFIIFQQCVWIFSYVLVEPTCLCYVIFPFLCAQLCVDISVSCLCGFLVSPLLVSCLYVFVLDSVIVTSCLILFVTYLLCTVFSFASFALFPSEFQLCSSVFPSPCVHMVWVSLCSLPCPPCSCVFCVSSL